MLKYDSILRKTPTLENCKARKCKKLCTTSHIFLSPHKEQQWRHIALVSQMIFNRYDLYPLSIQQYNMNITECYILTAEDPHLG